MAYRLYFLSSLLIHFNGITPVKPLCRVQKAETLDKYYIIKYYKLQTEYAKAMKRRVGQEDIPETRRIGGSAVMKS